MMFYGRHVLRRPHGTAPAAVKISSRNIPWGQERHQRNENSRLGLIESD